MEQVKTIDDIKKLYKILKNKRSVLNWGEFSDKIKYDRTYISRVINNHEPLTDDILTKINAAFDVANIVAPVINQANEDQAGYKKESSKKAVITNDESDLRALIQSNKNLTEARLFDAEAKLRDSEAALLLAQTNATLTAKALHNIDNGIKNEPEILEALNASMRGLLDAIAKVATGARFETEEIAVAELGKIVHEKHRKAIPADT